MNLPDVNLRVEHAGNEMQIHGSGPEYCVRFPSLWSAIHFGWNLWSLRKFVPRGMTVILAWRRWQYRYRT